MVSDYEKQREINVEKNKELLKSLGLDKPAFEPKEKRKQAKSETKKRKAPVEANEDSSEITKAPRTTSDAVTDTSIRRSSRNAGKRIDYRAEQLPRPSLPLSYSSGVKSLENAGPLGRDSGQRKYDPKTYGSIPGIEIGTWWESREGCSIDSIHAPWVAGISPGRQGAYSVALSGGYDDDIDLGYGFTYTGSGGRDLKGTKTAPKNLRTAPQSSDQTFEKNSNKALKLSSETKKPVRVIRGFKLRSRYAPSEGYRYDGLYQVEKAWMEKGLNPKGYLVCKFAFKRLPGQPPLPVNDAFDEDVEPDDNAESSEEAD